MRTIRLNPCIAHEHAPNDDQIFVIKLFLEGRKLHLFDTFEGMPILADSDPGGHKKGDFGDTSLDSVKELLADYNHVEYHPGFIPTTFDGVDGQFAFVHVDVDLFETSSACYEFFYPKMVKGGIMICDDYGFRKYETSARKAVDTFFADDCTETRLISEQSSQCLCLAMSMLPFEQRQVISLVDLERFTYQEIADITSTPIGTVMSRISRGRENLVKYVKQIEKGKRNVVPLRSQS